MNFRFSVDDNIWFFQDLAKNNYSSIFENSYLALYKRLHEKYNIKVQLNLFYQFEDFNLSQMPDRYKQEWIANKDWLQLSFHSKTEQTLYTNSSYDELYNDCLAVNNNIIRFAGKEVLNPFTTVHCCKTTDGGNKALHDLGVKGLAGLFGNKQNPRDSYNLKYENYKNIYDDCYYYDKKYDMFFVNLDMVINTFKLEDIIPYLSNLIGKEHIEIMIHEQYFYPHYYMYQPDYEKKIETAVSYLISHNYTSCFLNEIKMSEL
ncbi:MAG TPA: hypothetical protein VIL26_02260 [Clostridia bacterium]